jgi:hypothetical protein
MNHDQLPGWTGQAKQILDDSAQGIDAATLSRLNRARQAALDAARPRRLRPWFAPAGLASACAVLLAVAVAWHSPGSAPAPFEGQANAALSDGDDMDLVSSDDGFEFYQDLDFYAWLDAQSQDHNG